VIGAEPVLPGFTLDLARLFAELDIEGLDDSDQRSCPVDTQA
jgi:hypothetical protein